MIKYHRQTYSTPLSHKEWISQTLYGENELLTNGNNSTLFKLSKHLDSILFLFWFSFPFFSNFFFLSISNYRPNIRQLGTILRNLLLSYHSNVFISNKRWSIIQPTYSSIQLWLNASENRNRTDPFFPPLVIRKQQLTRSHKIFKFHHSR